MTEKSGTRLYPRLLHSDARDLSENYADLSLSELEDRADVQHPRSIFTSTGGTRVSQATLRDLRQGVRKIAVEAGYPSPFPDAPPHRSRLDFDFEAARFLHEEMAIVTGEAGKDDVWEFLSCVLLPDVVRWRFPGSSRNDHRTSEERFLGGVRNTFQRLWWRAEVLVGEDGFGVLRRLNEDELVQIMERPLIASHREVARRMASMFLELVDRHADIDRMHVMRDAQKRLRRLTPIISFSALDDFRIDATVREVLGKSARAVSGVSVEGWVLDRQPKRGAKPGHGVVESLAGEVESELRPPGPTIVKVLVDSYPGRLDAREIVAEVNSRRQNDDGGATKSDVNGFLYGDLKPFLERVGETPPEWRLKPAVVPDREPGRTDIDVSPDGAAAPKRPESTSEGDSGRPSVQPDIDRPGTGESRNVLRVVLNNHGGELQPELAGDREDYDGPVQYRKIISRLVELQAPFFRNGPRQLRPMTAQDLAEDLNIHSSTVSRATSGVRLAYRHQVIAAKDLFSPGLPTASGTEVSATAVRAMIADLLTTGGEESESLTDAEITRHLNRRGIEIARRTVAKYRDQLGISSSTGRSGEAAVSGLPGFPVRRAPKSADHSTESGTTDSAAPDEISDSNDHRRRLRDEILRVLSQHGPGLTALEISQHLPGSDRGLVEKLLRGPLDDEVDDEGVSPPRWFIVSEAGESRGSTGSDDSLSSWDTVVLDTLRRSPFRLTAQDIANMINEDAELEVDRTAVEAILRGPLQNHVDCHGGSPATWSARES